MHAKVNWEKGVKGYEPFIGGRKKRQRDAQIAMVEQTKIDKCLNCTKSAKECKGNCMGV